MKIHQKSIESSAPFLAWLRSSVCLLLLVALLTDARAGVAIEHWVHPTGARVYWINSPALPMLDIRVQLDAGSRYDPRAQAGLADATAALLFSGVRAYNGQKARDDEALNHAWLDLGAQAAADASADHLTFSVRTLTEPQKLNAAVALAAQMLAAPHFDAAFWQDEREQRMAGLREQATLAPSVAERAFVAAVYGNHPYGQMETAQTLAAIAARDIQAFYQRHFLACRAAVMLVGAIDRQQAEQMAQQLLAGLAARSCTPAPVVPPVPALTQAVEQWQPFAATQAQIRIGQPGITQKDPDFFAFLLGNHILGGGGFGSRLMTEIREKRGLTYGVSSQLTAADQAGMLRIALGTRADQAQQAVGLIRQIVASFVAEGPTAQELGTAQAFLTDSFALRLDSNQKLMQQLSLMAAYQLPIDYLDTWRAKVQAVRAEDIRRAFSRLIQPGRMAWVVVGARQP